MVVMVAVEVVLVHDEDVMIELLVEEDRLVEVDGVFTTETNDERLQLEMD